MLALKIRNWLTCVLPELVDVIVSVVGVVVVVVVVEVVVEVTRAGVEVTGGGGRHPQLEGGKGPSVGLNLL